jgi:hypothetical protein
MRIVIGTILAASAGCCGFLGGDEAPVSTAPPAGESRYVYAKGGLNIRTSADAGAEVAIQVPTDAQLIVTGPAAKPATVDGVRGGWVPAWYGGKSGFVFDAYIAPRPPPPSPCPSLEKWADQLGRLGSPVTVEERKCAGDVDCGDIFRRDRTSLRDNAWYEQSSGYEWIEEKLYLPATTLAAAWMGGRRCAGDEVGLPSMQLPTRDGKQTTRTPEGPIELEIHVEPGKVVVSWQDVAYDTFTVEQVGVDAQVTHGSGL